MFCHPVFVLPFIFLFAKNVKSDTVILETYKIPDRIQQKIEKEHVNVPDRLIPPFLSESIAHIILNPIDSDPMEAARVEDIRVKWEENWKHFSERHEQLRITELIKSCAIHSQFENLPFLFPRFLCALSFVYRELQKPRLNFTEVLFPRVTDAIKFLNDKDNYPCHSMNMTDVVAMVPGRIYSGCVDDTNTIAFSQFSSAFVMTHPFPDVSKKPCPTTCELRSILLQHKIIYQHEDCCCDGEMCALLVFTQTTSLTPLIMKTIDLSKETMVALPTTSTPKPTGIRRRATATTPAYNFIFGRR
ncbi:hypothetical protein L3Y34_002341 [Caenorhabditis briggsae]|uniref:Uncharacterized protein n=1 Tax=Caenorhabditis briggsae TaxID=6238 RepID=A0AAE9ISH1_CAEBR|nr:hypothetical protein L3Y34_002341 [Caenorhabditis briggsae]